MSIVGNLHLERAIAYKVEGNYDAALVELRELIAEEPTSGEARHQMGLVLGFIGEFDQSLEELKKAAELDSADVTTLIDLAKTLAMLGMYDEAKEGFLRVLELEPANEVAKQNLVFFQ